MKRLMLIAAMLLSLVGCADTTELGDRAIIQLAAIDCDDGGYTLNALLFSAGGSGGELDVTQTNVIRVTGSGETLGQAVQSLSLADGKEIYMSETKLIVLGGGFEEKDAVSALTTLYRDMRCSLNTPVCCAEKAELLAELEFTEGITAAEKPVDLIKNAFLSGVSPQATLLDVLADNEGGRPTLIPSFTEGKNGSGMTKDKEGRTALLDGARVLSGGRLGAHADIDQTAGAVLLSGETDSVKLSFLLDGEETSCEAYRIRADIKGGKPEVTAYYRSATGSALTEAQKEAAKAQLLSIVGKGADFMLQNEI